MSSPGFQIIRSSPSSPKTWSSASPPVNVSFSVLPNSESVPPFPWSVGSALAEELVGARAPDERVVVGVAESCPAGSAPLASLKVIASLPASASTRISEVLATVGVPPDTGTAPPFTRIVPAASRESTIELGAASPVTVNTPLKNDAVVAALADGLAARITRDRPRGRPAAVGACAASSGSDSRSSPAPRGRHSVTSRTAMRTTPRAGASWRPCPSWDVEVEDDWTLERSEKRTGALLGRARPRAADYRSRSAAVETDGVHRPWVVCIGECKHTVLRVCGRLPLQRRWEGETERRSAVAKVADVPQQDVECRIVASAGAVWHVVAVQVEVPLLSVRLVRREGEAGQVDRYRLGPAIRAPGGSGAWRSQRCPPGRGGRSGTIRNGPWVADALIVSACTACVNRVSAQIAGRITGGDFVVRGFVSVASADHRRHWDRTGWSDRSRGGGTPERARRTAAPALQP